MPLGRSGNGRAHPMCFHALGALLPRLTTVTCICFVQFARCLQWEVEHAPDNSFMAGCGSAVSFAGSIFMIIYD